MEWSAVQLNSKVADRSSLSNLAVGAAFAAVTNDTNSITNNLLLLRNTTPPPD